MINRFLKLSAIATLVAFGLSSCGIDDNFGYVEPKRDEHGLLIARTDLKNPQDVTDGYTSIKELFSKLNSMTPTQVEPMYKPFYYGENDKQTGQEIPTFIIVGDIHADEYSIQNDLSTMRHLLKNHLIENNEDANSEVEAVELLHKKFGIKNIGLENEPNNGEFISKIGVGIKNLGINAIGLENMELIQEKVANIMSEFVVYSVAMPKYLGLPIDLQWTPEEIAQISQDANFLKTMQEDDPNEFLKKHLDKTQEEQVQLVKNFLKENFEKEKNNKDLAEKSTKYGYYITKKMFAQDDPEIMATIVQMAKEVSKDDFDTYMEKMAQNIVSIHHTIIVERNKIGLDLMTKNPLDDSIFVMVYGKWHIDDLITQIKERYQNKVNIYVAK